MIFHKSVFLQQEAEDEENGYPVSEGFDYEVCIDMNVKVCSSNPPFTFLFVIHQVAENATGAWMMFEVLQQ